MSLHLRVDDFPGTKPEEFDRHNLQNFKRFHSVLETRSVTPYVLGVIPGYTSPNDLWWLKEQPGIIVAMHGVVHSERLSDEFRDKLYRDIENALHRMKDSFEASLETRVVDYIPPHNIISPDTVLALSRLGFERVWGGPETDEDMKRFIRLNGMEYIHSQPPLEYGRSDELMERGSVEHLREKASEGDIYLTLHWTWETNIGLHNLRMYLDKIHDLF